MQNYEVIINQNWSETVRVSASSPKEAREKAWKNWKPKKKNYIIYTDKCEK